MNRRPWHDGREAWDRLRGWFVDHTRGSAPVTDEQADDSLSALVDVRHLRSLLDQAELVAVKTARRGRKSWAEISTAVGITRQSAWERWRDLDAGQHGGEGRSTDTTEDDVETIESGLYARVQGPGPSTADEVLGAAVEDMLHPAADGSHDDLDRPRDRRSRRHVLVPDVVGLAWDDARLVLRGVQLVAVPGDPDGPPLIGADGVVSGQEPAPGKRVTTGSHVRIWIDPNGGAGVREPRRPLPRSQAGRETLSDPT